MLTPSYFPIVGGTETHVRDLAMTLKKHNFTSEVITLCDTRKWESSKVLKRKILDDEYVLVWPSFPMGKPVSTYDLTQVHYLPNLLFRLREHVNQFSLLHFHDDRDLSFPLSLGRIKKPRVFSCHSLSYTLNFYRRQLLARRIFTRSADLFHVLSRNDAKNLAMLGVEGDKIRIIPNSIDINRFSSKTSDELSHDSIRIVWAGRIERQKGLIVLLQAVNKLRIEFPQLELLIAGRVWDPPYFRELANYKEANNLKEARFIGFAKDLPSFLKQGDIFVLPSLMEVFPISILEAMSSGLPVVASSIAGVPDEVADNETGFLVPPSDPVKLAEKLRILIADGKLRREMGRRGRERAESLFSIDKVFPSVLNMYHELI
jgi:glycosyltransferase involved in cell wall biosynthesis